MKYFIMKSIIIIFIFINLYIFFQWQIVISNGMKKGESSSHNNNNNTITLAESLFIFMLQFFLSSLLENKIKSNKDWFWNPCLHIHISLELFCFTKGRALNVLHHWRDLNFPNNSNKEVPKKHSTKNGRCCIPIYVYGFANLLQHPDMANPMCSCS